jgi:tetratricopeptide (TPR) repeat protein
VAAIRCDIDQAKKYLQGMMHAEEAAAFEKNLESDPQFREEFDFNRELLESMRIHYKATLKEKLHNLEGASVLHKQSSIKSTKIFRIAGMAAAIALAITLGYGLLFNPTDPQATFEQYYSPYYNVLDGAERSIENESGDLAMRLYDQQRYEEAVKVFDTALTKDPDNINLQFYKALSLMSIGQADSAIVQLKQVLENTQDPWYEPARWYLGLAYLQSGDVSQAKGIFTAIMASDDSYSERAGELLETLN